MALRHDGQSRVGHIMPYAGIEKTALGIQQLFGKFASAFGGLGLSILLGLDPLPSLRGAQSLFRDNVAGVVAILVIVVAIGGGSFWITWRRANQRKPIKNPLMRLARAVGESLIEIIIGVIAGLLLGIGSAPSTIPIITLIRAHPPIAIAIAGALLLLLILAPLIGGEDEGNSISAGGEGGQGNAGDGHHEDDSPELGRASRSARLWFSTATSFVCLLLLFSLFGMVTIRPSWCPTSICPAPQVILVTNRNGVNDGVMESYFLAQQSAHFILTRDLSAYTINNLPGGNTPNSVGAIEIGASTLPYSAVIGIHSLQRNTRYGLIIDGVDLIIDKITPVTGPVNVFLHGAGLTFSSEVYAYKYFSQPPGYPITTIPPKSTIGLEVGGSDELAVQVTSSTEVAVQFHLQVRYHQIVGGVATRTLIIPHEFAVEFVSPAHWKSYLFVGGKMIPQT